MNNSRRFYARLIACLHVLFAIGLSMTVFALQQSKVSPQYFREMILLFIGIYIIACVVLIPKIRRLSLDSGKVQSNWKQVKVWNLRFLIVLMVFSLIFGNWVERDGPLIPRIVGTIANLALTGFLVKNLLSLQMK